MIEEPTCTVDSDGTKRWRNQAYKLHRADGPAIEWGDGTMWFFQNGLCHRLDGPAVEYLNGEVEYWINGVEYPEVLTFWLAAGEYRLQNPVDK